MQSDHDHGLISWMTDYPCHHSPHPPTRPIADIINQVGRALPADLASNSESLEATLLDQNWYRGEKTKNAAKRQVFIATYSSLINHCKTRKQSKKRIKTNRNRSCI